MAIDLRPEDIDLSSHLWDTFDHYETECSAWWILKYLADRGEGWVSFTFDEINSFYNKKHNERFCFNRLLPSSVHQNGDHYSVTDLFKRKVICRAHFE